MNNDEKIKEIIQSEEIPEQLSPDNIKLMLYDKTPKNKRSSAVFLSRFAAAAAAIVLIVNGASAYLEHEKFLRSNTEYAIANITKASFKNKAGSYMSGSEDYGQVFEVFEKAYENYKKVQAAQRPITSGIEESNVASGIDEAAEEDYNNYDEPQYNSDQDTDALPEHSDTYNQEAGVLEADKVKTDGKLIYRLSADTNYQTMIRVITADNGKVEQAAVIDINDVLDDRYDSHYRTYTVANNMYLYNDMLIVTGSVYAADMSEEPVFSDYDHRGVPMFVDGRCMNKETFTAVYTAGESPELINIFYQEGRFNDVRITPEGYMYVVSEYVSKVIDSSSPERPETFVPYCGDLDSMDFMLPEDILLPDGYVPPSKYLPYAVISSIDLNETNDPKLSDTKALADCAGDLYCSTDNMYIGYGWGDTTITRIALEGGAIQPQAAGTVDGEVKDQFSMSEYNGYFRVASTGYTWTGRRTNYVTVMDMDMHRVGGLAGIGENEEIKSVNFQGDKGYVVTFRLSDPLFAIDLSDPTNPTLTDALEIDGYSSYMQKWTDGLLLGTGVTTDESGWENGVKLVMFDTSDPNELKECGIWSLSDRHGGIGSFAISNRKTLLIAPEKNLIAYPIIIDNKSSYLFFSYENGEFILRGSLSNDTESRYAHYLDRAIYIGDYVYVLSDGNIISADMDTFTETDRLVMSGDEVTHEEADPEPVYYENGTMLNETPGDYSDDEYTDYEETSTSPEPEEYVSGTGYEDKGSEPIGSSGPASEENSAVSTGEFVREREISVSGVSEP